METTSSAGTGNFFEKYGTALAVLVGALIIGGAFAFGQGGDKSAMPVTGLDAVTQSVEGVDAERVKSLVKEKRGEYVALSAADRDEGSSFGINGTPSIIIGKQFFSGGQSYDTIAAAIEAELAGTAVANTETPVDIANVKTEGSPTIGSPTAPVTMAVWFDYQCPHCQNFELTTMSRIEEEYVKTGKVRVVYKDFQFLGPASDQAALYARAVWESNPDKFSEWFRAVMEMQAGA